MPYLLSDVQHETPQAQLEPISSCPIVSCLGEETDYNLTITSFQVDVESNELLEVRTFWVFLFLS